MRPAPGEVDHLWSMHVLDEFVKNLVADARRSRD